MDPLGRTADQEIARIATGAHGIVTRRELIGSAVSDQEIKVRVRRGTLIREYPGVYRVGHRAPSVEARYLAAVRACGEGAVLSGRAAGYLLRILKGKPPPPEVTTPTERRNQSIRTRRCRSLDPRETTTYRGIPVTTVPRTIVDLAADLTLDSLGRVCHEAGVLHRTTPRQVDAVVKRRHRIPGSAKLTKVLHGDVHVLLSELERAFFKLLRDNNLPLPVTNRPAGAHRVDCRWPDHPLTVELDSYRFHNSRHAWEQGHRRRREARDRGDVFRQYTWTDVTEDTGPMLRELRKLLSA